MLSVTDMIKYIRTNTHDIEETGYSDDELLVYINDAARFIRRIILDINPMLLADAPITGNLSANQSSIELPSVASKILTVQCDNTELEVMDHTVLDNKAGHPESYFLSGFRVINFYPIPDTNINYLVRVVSDLKLLSLADNSPFPTDFDDFIYEYVTIRSSMANEFDMSQESSLLSNIIAQLETTIRNISNTSGISIDGYWDKSRHKYGRRY